MKLFSVFAALFLIAFVPACGDDPVDEHESPATDACEHLKEGPMVALTASDEPVGASEAPNLHTRYDITLADMGGTPGGFVAIPIAVAGDHLFFFNADMTLSLADASGVVITAEAGGTSTPECAEVGRWVRYDLTVGTYTLELSGPSGASVVSFVHVIDGGAHNHD